jgi:hypothetical protein
MTAFFDRELLIENYVEQIIDNMDSKTMMRIIYETLVDNLSSYSDEELITVVTEHYPELLENVK